MDASDVYSILGPPHKLHGTISIIGHSELGERMDLWGGDYNEHRIVVCYGANGRVVDKEWRPFGDRNREVVVFTDRKRRVYRSTIKNHQEEIEELVGNP
jgi:hypothetical protein